MTTIGNLKLPNRLILAPMAGVTDLAFREICRDHGAGLTVTEMVSAKALEFGDKKTPSLMALGPEEHPAAVQIFGSDPACMARSAQRAAEISGCDLIDINMGCPAPKIVNNGDGSALMKSPDLAARIIEAVKQAVRVPVTVKFRLGWDASHINCVSFAQMCARAGADMIAVHGRTRSQQYEGKADWDQIRAVKQSVSIPVAANGDVFTPEDVPRILEHTGADFVMIGRGSLGDPWIFERANARLESGVVPPLPPFSVRIHTAVRQIERAAQYKGERVALLEARRHVNWYLKGVPCVRDFKKRISALTTLDELYALAREMEEQISD